MYLLFGVNIVLTLSLQFVHGMMRLSQEQSIYDIKSDFKDLKYLWKRSIICTHGIMGTSILYICVKYLIYDLDHILRNASHCVSV